MKKNNNKEKSLVTQVERYSEKENVGVDLV